MDCRINCGACCIAPSFKQVVFGMDHPKHAGEPCIHLTTDMRCAIYGQPERPGFCQAFHADPLFCGSSREEALAILSDLERTTLPLSQGCTAFSSQNRPD